MNQDPQLAFLYALNELIATLLKIQALVSGDARDTLLSGIPGRWSVKRSNIVVTDLINIANHAAGSSGAVLMIFRKNVLLYVPEAHPHHDMVIKCLDALEESLPPGPPGAPQERISRVLSHIDVPFTNRDDELKLVLTSRSPAHHVLDGPVGYGKTRLLKKLEKILASPEQSYVCGYVSARDSQTMGKFMTALCENLDMDANSVVSTDRDARRIGVRFGHEILKTKFPDAPESFEHEGVILLLDDIGPQFPDVSQEVLEVFIPTVEETLRTNRFFSTRSNAFRVILSGRYLAQFITSLVPKLPWELSITILKPFDYKVVWDTARMVLAQHEDVEQTSAHILHLTGGHPCCMAQVLCFYQEHTCKPETFRQLYSQQVWSDIVRPQVEEIRDSIPSHLRPICDRLSAFRVFNCEILQQLLEKKAFHYDGDEFALHDELAGTHLYDSTPVRYVKGAIIGRMLALQFRHSRRASKFSAFCDEAYKTCLLLLKEEKRLQNRDLWTVECLFQALQKHVDSIGTVEQRLALRENFFGVAVADVLGTFMLGSEKQKKEADTIGSRVQKQELEALVREMNEDENWDFRFSVNYYLREEFYNEEPFEQLVDTVRAWRKEEVDDAESSS